jgi:hypothetical protein
MYTSAPDGAFKLQLECRFTLFKVSVQARILSLSLTSVRVMEM